MKGEKDMSAKNADIFEFLSPKQLAEYEKIYITDEDVTVPEMSLDEIFEHMLEIYVDRQNERLQCRLSPLSYLELGEKQRSLCVDMARLLVTAKSVG